jgi:hypothetical protein
VVTYSTIGQANPAERAGRKGYRYRGDPDWTPGAHRSEDESPRTMRPGSAGVVNATRREGRLQEFAAVLTDLGYPDPRKATPAAVIEAGKQAGVGDRTAKSYHGELKRRRLSEETADA